MRKKVKSDVGYSVISANKLESALTSRLCPAIQSTFRKQSDLRVLHPTTEVLLRTEQADFQYSTTFVRQVLDGFICIDGSQVLVRATHVYVLNLLVLIALLSCLSLSQDL